jgi:hypothetical protein
MPFVVLLGALLLTLAVVVLAWAFPRAPSRRVRRR